MAWPARSPDLNPLHFFLRGRMKLRMYHGGKLEARPIDKTAVGNRNELGCMQGQHSVTQRQAAYIRPRGENFVNVL
jgi:hypothetical protein